MKKILILYTGGTIGMMHHHKTKALVPFNFSKITDHIPELRHLDCRIHFHSRRPPIDSSNVDLKFWLDLATDIEKNYSRHDGFVVLHGTDTMAYTASVLSFMLENLNKPVILTGSQVPLGTIRNDARRNIITAVEIAASKTVIPEVCIYFSNQLFRGNRAEKYTSSKFDAFHSTNYPPLAEAGVNIEFNMEAIRKNHSGKKFIVHKMIDTSVALIKIFPGLSVELSESILNSPGVKGAVIETYGSGNAPTNKEFIQTLERAIKRGLILVNVSQCSGGTVDQGKYETSIHLKEIGVLSGKDMTTEAALGKLMFLLGNYKNNNEIKRLFQQNLRGEMS